MRDCNKLGVARVIVTDEQHMRYSTELQQGVVPGTVVDKNGRAHRAEIPRLIVSGLD